MICVGDHEYIDVINRGHAGNSDRFLIDIDFRSHFEIARAVDSYDRILNSLPVVFVGLSVRLSQYLQVMAEAARFSLKQNSMPLPPWRSLAYLQAKWQSPYQRVMCPDEDGFVARANPFGHKQCHGHLKRLQSLLRSETGNDQRVLMKPLNGDNNWRRKPERIRHYLY